MRITSIESKLLAEIRYLNAGRGPGRSILTRRCRPRSSRLRPCIARGHVCDCRHGRPAKSRETFESAGGQPLRLLGEVLPAMLRADVLPSLGLPKGDIGVLLAGDFYTVPALDKRGGSGRTYGPSGTRSSAEFDWVAGVAGNHDTFYRRCEQAELHWPGSLPGQRPRDDRRRFDRRT